MLYDPAAAGGAIPVKQVGGVKRAFEGTGVFDVAAAFATPSSNAAGAFDGDAATAYAHASAASEEAGNAPFCRLQEKFEAVVLRGVGNVSETPLKSPYEISPVKVHLPHFPPS